MISILDFFYPINYPVHFEIQIVFYQIEPPEFKKVRINND